LASGVRVGEGAVIAEGAVIGHGALIPPQTVLARDARIVAEVPATSV